MSYLSGAPQRAGLGLVRLCQIENYRPPGKMLRLVIAAGVFCSAQKVSELVV